jgi:histidinol-phosphate phosphatase family protein
VARFVFLDRDGTVIRDPGYGPDLADYELLPGTVEGLLRLTEGGFELAIVTNQSGIGRGYFDEPRYEAFRRHVEADLARQGVAIVRTYHCPHRPEAGCRCRKPEPGLLLRARDELGADLAASWVVGDKASDVELAVRAGCAGGLRIGGPAVGSEAVADLREAARVILARSRGKRP